MGEKRDEIRKGLVKEIMIGKYTIYFIASKVTDIAYDYCMYYIGRGDIVNSLKWARYALIVTKLVERISGVKIRRIYNI